MVDIMTRHPSFAKKPSRSQFADIPQDDELEDIPEEERFDWKTTRSICIEGNHKHRAYGMPFEEYVKNRSKYIDADETERSRLSYYLPSFPSALSADCASLMHISANRFLNLMIEMGLITFQVDYHEPYNIIKRGRSDLLSSVKDDDSRHRYMRIAEYDIKLGSATGARCGSTKHHSPSVPVWLHDAIAEASTYLNMSTSDMVYLCWCFGAKKSLEQKYRNVVLDKEIEEILSNFDREINLYSKTISWIVSGNTV